MGGAQPQVNPRARGLPLPASCSKSNEADQARPVRWLPPLAPIPRPKVRSAIQRGPPACTAYCQHGPTVWAIEEPNRAPRLSGPPATAVSRQGWFHPWGQGRFMMVRMPVATIRWLRAARVRVETPAIYRRDPAKWW